MARLILTTPGEDTPAGGDADVIGTAAPGEVITLFPGVITLDPSFNLGGDVVVFPEARSAYTIVRDGSNVVIRSDDITITIPFGTAGIELRFADETLVLRVANNQLLIGDQIVTNTEAPIGGDSGLVATPIDAGTVSEDGAVVNVNLLSTASDSNGGAEPPAHLFSVGMIVSATTETGRVVSTTRTGSTLSIDPDQFNNLDDGETETVTVRYAITDGDGTIQNEVTLRVTGADDVPTSGPLFPSAITEDDPPIVINLLSRADDPDSEPVNVADILSVQTSSGQPLVYTRNGNSITIDPSQFGDALSGGESEQITITYSITDGDGIQAINTLNLIIEGVGPGATDDTGLTGEDNVLNASAGVGLLSNDSAGPGATLSVTEVNGVTANVGTQIALASGALLTVNADGSYAYNPNGQFEGLDTGESTTDSFTYEVSDSNGVADIGDVTITITGVNDAPVAQADSFTTVENINLIGNVLANDSDIDDEPINAVLVAGPAHAAAFTLNPDGSFSYTPAASYSGGDSFTYKANDGTADGNTVTVTLTVTGINGAPQGTNGSLSIFEDSSGVLDAAAFGFSDPGENNAFAGVIITTLPTNGQLQLAGSPIAAGTFVTAAQIAANQLVFLPDPNEDGAPYATFTFQVRDDGGTANGGQDTDQSPNTITVNIVSVNDAPTSTNFDGDSVTYFEDAAPVLLDNGSNAMLTDIDSPNFGGGQIDVSVIAGGTPAQDVLGISNVGGISVAGNAVSFNGTQFGTITFNGTGGNPLVVTLDTDATVGAVQALMRAFNYSNSNTTNPSGTPRTLTVGMTDGDGGFLTGLLITVNVTPDANPALIAGHMGIPGGGSWTFGAGDFGHGADGVSGFAPGPFAIPELSLA